MKKSVQKNNIVIHTDGGSRGNPGPAALGVYISSLDKKYGSYIGVATNNDAEYQAIIFALKKVKQLIGKEQTAHAHIEIRSDSQLIVNQLNGTFKIKEESLWKYFIEIWNLKQDFGSVVFIYIPREHNHIADALVNNALDEEKRAPHALW